jgi:hypothetical protein
LEHVGTPSYKILVGLEFPWTSLSYTVSSIDPNGWRYTAT